ncbi:hypothetical protein [Streptosporangium sp. KLBMP 9127]|nr:hypothetical protein [Streptosporangium sp. KLBMP 9127]
MLRTVFLRALAALALLVSPLAFSATAHAATPMDVLQMNLCNSGKATHCYKGGSAIYEAQVRINENLPQFVTLNEICEGDLNRIRAGIPASYEASDFRAAPHKDGGFVTCTNGERYGIGMIIKGPGSVSFGGPYELQDKTDERRVRLCVDWTSKMVCVTHLSSDSPGVAFHQCEELGLIASRDGEQEGKATVVAGDFNLKYGVYGQYDVQDCVPDRFFRKGDGDVQHVFAANVNFVSKTVIPMAHTDHPALLIKLQRP